MILLFSKKHFSKSFLCVSFCFIAVLSEAQNLIPNPSFENHTGCPSALSQINLAAPWFNPTTNTAGVTGTVDYYNVCATSVICSIPSQINSGGVYNYQAARTGDAMAGIYLYYIVGTYKDYREYLGIELTTPLTAGACYEFSMYMNVKFFTAISDDIGVYFSDTLITGITNYLPLNVTPQIENQTGNFPDSVSWTLVTGTYTAHGGESSIYIGNFKYDSLTTQQVYNPLYTPIDRCYVFIDDVSLVQTSCTGVEENIGSYFSIDPNQTKDYLTIKAEKLLGKNCLLTITDVSGKKLKQERKTFTTGTVTLDVSELKRGIYFLRMEDGRGNWVRRFVKG